MKRIISQLEYSFGFSSDGVNYRGKIGDGKKFLSSLSVGYIESNGKDSFKLFRINDDDFVKDIERDFTNSETIEDFINTPAFKKLVNYLYNKGLIRIDLDRLTEFEKPYFSQVLSCIDDLEFKKSLVKNNSLRKNNISLASIFTEEEISNVFSELFNGTENKKYELESFTSNIDKKAIFDFLTYSLKELAKSISNDHDDRQERDFIRSLFNKLLDDEKEEYTKICKEQGLNAVLEYSFGEIEKKDLDKLLLRFYTGKFKDAEKLKKQFQLFGINLDDVDSNNKEEGIKQIVLNLYERDIDVLDKIMEWNSFYDNYARARYDKSLIEYVENIDKDVLELFKVVYDSIKDTEFENSLSRDNKLLHWTISFDEYPAESIINLLELDKELFLFHGWRSNGAVLPVRELIEGYVEKHGKISLSPKELDSLLLSLAQDKCYESILRTAVSTESISNYLLGKEIESQDDELIFEKVLGFLSTDLLEELDIDEFKKAELFLRCTNIEFNPMMNCYNQFEDDFLKALITKTHGDKDGKQITSHDAIRFLNEYKKAKEEYSLLESDEDKSKYLIDLLTIPKDSSDSEKTMCCRNLMAKNLLKEISSHECRMDVIKNMNNVVNPRIHENVELAQNMLREFFMSRGELTPEKEENLEMIFNSYSVYLGENSYFDAGVNGIAEYLPQRIVIREPQVDEIPDGILVLIHECVHAFSNRDYNEKLNTFGKNVEEGLADTIAEIAFNEYMQKHKSIRVGERTYSSQEYVETKSSYHVPNAIIKTMMYGLEAEGQDRGALIEACIGDKEKFLEIAVGKEEAEEIEEQNKGRIRNVEFSPLKIFRLLGDKILKRQKQPEHESSPYLHRNKAIKIMEYYQKGGSEFIDWLDNLPSIDNMAVAASDYEDNSHEGEGANSCVSLASIRDRDKNISH